MTSDNQTNDSLEYLYKEYVRLGELCNSYVQSSFDDIKLFGGLSLLLAWKPIADAITQGGSVESGILLFGFIGILLVVSIISLRDLLKQSIVEFYISQISIYETEIKKRLTQEGATFEIADNWKEYYNQNYLKLYSRFVIAFCLLAIGYPSVILALQPNHRYYAVIYLGVGSMIVGLYLSALTILNRANLTKHQSVKQSQDVIGKKSKNRR